ncbi:hypothetical protein [Rhodophyticola porphyridii]|uniref:hypothetical protein n=1 Tax=Rhodophyticola porphyridii TaxID=1852017 RepID=UPI0035D09848
MTEIKKAKQTVKSKALEAKEAAQSRAKSAAEDLKSAASAAADDARAQVEAEASGVKARLADEITAVADGVSRTSERMTEDAPHTETVAAVARQLDRTADAVREADLGTIATRLSSFARRNPAAFLGGAAILGIAAGRFLKASSPEPAMQSDVQPHHIPQPAPAQLGNDSA